MNEDPSKDYMKARDSPLARECVLLAWGLFGVVAWVVRHWSYWGISGPVESFGVGVVQKIFVRVPFRRC